MGNEINNFFSAEGRGALAGKNDNSVEVKAVLLSVEAQGFDRSILNASNNNNFDHHGIDSLSDRSSEIRAGFSFYRGVASTGPPGSLAFAQRRRIIVIDTTEPGNPIVRHNDLPLSSGALGQTNIDLIRAAVNQATPFVPPPAGTTFASWATEHSLASGSDSPHDDPDGDGWQNALEFSAGTNPSVASSFPNYTLQKTENGFSLSYTRLVPAIDLTRTWEMGPLSSVTSEFIPSIDDTVVEATADPELEKVTISLPSDFGPFIRLRVGVE
ncbi:MAG: hypothetical protein ACON4K_12770 [Akkermansiaceae bacterium]